MAFKSTDFKGHFVTWEKCEGVHIKFKYLYRDAGNYKQFNEVVFANPDRLSVQEVDKAIRQRLIDGQWFVPEEWQLARLHSKDYPWDPALDHDWHEYEGIEETMELATEERSIDKFLESIGFASSLK